MSKKDDYRLKLKSLQNWEDYLLENCNLPGPRGNIELAQAVADEGTAEHFERYRAYHADVAPTNSPYEFLAFCGVLGLGRLLAEGQTGLLPTLRRCASDPRWRIREAVAMALQRFGDANMPSLIQEMKSWSMGAPLEQRAAAAALCEPRLLAGAEHARAVLHILDGITTSMLSFPERNSENFRILRQGLGYCWSVAVVASPAEGRALIEKWSVNPDAQVRWIMHENLKKNRLMRMDPGWVKICQERVAGKP